MKSNGVLLLIASLALIACTDKLEAEFTSGCRSGGASDAVCQCIYNKIEARLKVIEKQSQIGFSPGFKAAYANAIVACVR